MKLTLTTHWECGLAPQHPAFPALETVGKSPEKLPRPQSLELLTPTLDLPAEHGAVSPHALIDSGIVDRVERESTREVILGRESASAVGKTNIHDETHSPGNQST